MEFSIGFLKSQHQAIIKSFGQDMPMAKIVNTDDLEQEKLSALYIPQDLYNGQVMEELNSFNKLIPLREAKEYELHTENFEKLTYQQGKTILDKTKFKWSLENNLFLLEELFAVITNLRLLGKDSRITLFEELWFILKNNLAAENLKIIFNNIQENEGKKNQLIPIKVEGDKRPNPEDAGEEDIFILNNLKDSLTEEFQVIDIDLEKGKLMAGLNVLHSPVIILAEITQFTAIQKGLLKSLFNGLNIELN
ncbi:MAG: hypothetical protein ACO20H_13005 [Bacteriovoracaceae bacterium]